MICPNCHTLFDLPANFCPNCGVSLQRSGRRILIVTAVLVLVIIFGTYGYVKHRLYSGPEAAYQASAQPPSDSTIDRPATESRSDVQALSQPSNQPLPVDTANFTLIDITGREFLNTPVVILSPGWFAFPKRPCIGGYTWRIALDANRMLEAEGGILGDADPVGLWQLSANPFQDGSELMPWAPDQPLTWYPLNGQHASRQVEIHDIENLNNFARIPFEVDDAGSGIFVQNGWVVGWSFGEWLTGGFLWTGNPGSELIPEFYIEDFYRLTFEGGREEAFLLALDDTNFSNLQQLSALVEAYRLEPRLTRNETPEHIRPARILATMRDLIERLRVQGRNEEIFPLFDPQTVATINHLQLVTNLAAIARDTGDYAYALALVNSFEASFDREAVERGEIDVLQAALYRGWLNQLIAAGEINDARLIYEEASDHFPQDPAIHLAGVELALKLQSWTLAERLLAARNYPIELRETASRLQQQISERKSQEGKIVIRYQPGSRTIPVTAKLDQGLNQRFLIDTGASIVTVPSATVRRLGIDLSDNLPRRLFYSATGVHNAIEVTLPYIELNGWAIQDVKALVVDLPGQSGVGLLGMNYLRNFKLEVNTADGVLTLEPL
jgi:clan AA aspartic protease (TIGR02281 family)